MINTVYHLLVQSYLLGEGRGGGLINFLSMKSGGEGGLSRGRGLIRGGGLNRGFTVMLKLSNYFPFSFFRRTSGGTGTDFSLKLRLNSRRSGTREERQMTWMIPSHKQSLMLF